MRWRVAVAGATALLVVAGGTVLWTIRAASPSPTASVPPNPRKAVPTSSPTTPTTPPPTPDQVAASASPVPAAPQVAARIAVSGNSLVDAGGRAITLRGANVSGTEFACDQGGTPSKRGWSIYGGQPLDSASTFEAMRAWHIHVVRVPLNEDCWLGINGVQPAFGGVAYVRAIEKEVGLIQSAGMAVVLDLHWSAPGSWAAVAQQPLPDADHSLAFWTSVATAFHEDLGVLFDLFNEPFVYDSYQADPRVSPWDCWRIGCIMTQFISGGQVGPDGSTTDYTHPVTWRSAGMQTLVDAIRATGATQPIIVNGLDWSNDLSGWLAHAPVDPLGQLVAGWHSYPGEKCDVEACWNLAVAPVVRTVPVVIGEVGDEVCGPAPYVGGLLSWADGLHLSYLGWTWNPWSNCDDVLVTSWAGTPTSNYGTQYLSHLRALP